MEVAGRPVRRQSIDSHVSANENRVPPNRPIPHSITFAAFGISLDTDVYEDDTPKSNSLSATHDDSLSGPEFLEQSSAD